MFYKVVKVLFFITIKQLRKVSVHVFYDYFQAQLYYYSELPWLSDSMPEDILLEAEHRFSN